jgi:hypothetical protein
MTITDKLEGQEGFFIGLGFNDEELSRVREIIHRHWIRVIKSRVGPAEAISFESLGIANYHEKSHLLDHHKTWPKVNRVLDAIDVIEIRKTSLFKSLERAYGKFKLSDEEGFGEVIVWRMVRPGALDDVGPIHADAWFWEVGGNGITPDGYQRVRVWVSIYPQDITGFLYVPGSHRENIPYKNVIKYGMNKPRIDIDPDTLSIAHFMGKPGEAIVFHDRLLHGGIAGSMGTRISLEFTMFVKKEIYLSRFHSNSTSD